MNVITFVDKYKRLLEEFREEVESGKHKPLTLSDPNECHQDEWWAFFRNWLKNS